MIATAHHADPRALLAAMVSDRGDSLAALSRMIGRNAAYLQQFVTRGSPRMLAERDRRLLARYFGVAESLLGGADMPELAAVPRLDIAAAAGAGVLADGDGPERQTRVDRALLRMLGVRADAASFIGVTGESMEPTLIAGDDILIDRDDRTIGDRPALFVVRVDGALMVKRASMRAGRLRLQSDNPAFAEIDIDPAAAQPVGRVVWLGRAIPSR